MLELVIKLKLQYYDLKMVTRITRLIQHSYTIMNLTLTDMHHNISYGDELPKHVPLLLRLQITGI